MTLIRILSVLTKVTKNNRLQPSNNNNTSNRCCRRRRVLENVLSCVHVGNVNVSPTATRQIVKNGDDGISIALKKQLTVSYVQAIIYYHEFLAVHADISLITFVN